MPLTTDEGTARDEGEEPEKEAKLSLLILSGGRVASRSTSAATTATNAVYCCF